jgi:hypothetical protein
VGFAAGGALTRSSRRAETGRVVVRSTRGFDGRLAERGAGDGTDASSATAGGGMAGVTTASVSATPASDAVGSGAVGAAVSTG